MQCQFMSSEITYALVFSVEGSLIDKMSHRQGRSYILSYKIKSLEYLYINIKSRPCLNDKCIGLDQTLMFFTIHYLLSICFSKVQVKQRVGSLPFTMSSTALIASREDAGTDIEFFYLY